MSETQTQLPTDTWIYASWQEYEEAIANLLDEKGKSYYYKGYMRLEMPAGTGIVKLDRYPAPDLVIEIAKTSLLDDLGTKRSLYEELGVAEYWVVDVQNAQIIAYAIVDQGSRRIRESQVLPGLAMSILEEALRRSREMSQSEVGTWLLSQFQQKED
ncbi:Uma2 family endonuclease [Nostoc sp.]|uniref:Uma2 family endonuclease n=1 Tax=Nostoc sp. TaxID=1180 RepID=UPI003593AD5C